MGERLFVRTARCPPVMAGRLENRNAAQVEAALLRKERRAIARLLEARDDLARSVA